MTKVINLAFILAGISIIAGGGYFTVGTLLLSNSVENATVPVVSMFISKPSEILESEECSKYQGQKLLEVNSSASGEKFGMIKCEYEKGELYLVTEDSSNKVHQAKYYQIGCTDDPEKLSDPEYLEMIGYPKALMQYGAHVPSSLGELQSEHKDSAYLQVYKNRFVDGMVVISCENNELLITVENPVDFEEAFETEGKDLDTFFDEVQESL